MSVRRDRAYLRTTVSHIIRSIVERQSHEHRDVRSDQLAPRPLSSFRRLEPIGFGRNLDEEWIFHPADCEPNLVWPLDVAYVVEKSGSEGDLHLAHYYTVAPKQVRGIVHRFSPYMVRHDIAQIVEGRYLRASGIEVWLNGHWLDADKRTIWEGRSEQDSIPTKQTSFSERDRVQARLATAIALRQRYEWAISLGKDGTPSIRFSTDPTGLKDLFRLRDLPHDGDRREALLTWVSDHWRQDRSDPEAERYVRKHLRGATTFEWDGFEVEVLPAQFDLDQRDKLVAEREALRVAGKDKRRRVGSPIR